MKSRVSNRAGVGKWPAIFVHHRRARVSMKARTLGPKGLIWWARLRGLAGLAARFCIAACVFSLFVPEVLYLPEALKWLGYSIAALILSKQRLLWLAGLVFGQTMVMEWSDEEVILYPQAGWRFPKRINRTGLEVIASLEPMDETREMEMRARVLAQPGQAEDISGAAFAGSQWVTLQVGGNALRIASVWGHHAKLLVAGILNAEAIFKELTQEKEQALTAHFSVAE